jgi:flagellar motor switch protein FliM
MTEEDRHIHSSEHKLNGSMLDQPGIAIDRLPGLAIVLDTFAANLCPALQPLFGEAPTSVVEKMTTAALFEMISKCKGQFAGVLRCEDLDSRLLIIFDANVVEILLASIFGSDATKRDDRQSSGLAKRPPTTLDKRLVTEAARQLGQALELGFAQFAKASFSFEDLRTLSDAYVLGRKDMPILMARVGIKTSAGTCGCTVVLPQTLLQALRRELSADPSRTTAASDPRWARQMEVGVTKARLPVTAILEEFEMTLADITKLEVGRVIDLHGAGMGRVRLDCAGRGVFWGKVGQAEGRYSLEIADAIEADGETAELIPGF